MHVSDQSFIALVYNVAFAECGPYDGFFCIEEITGA